MIYALKVSDAARRSIGILPLDLQEAVWDLLEQIVIDRDESNRRTRLDAAAHQLIYRGEGGLKLRLDLAIVVDHDSRVVHLLALSLVE